LRATRGFRYNSAVPRRGEQIRTRLDTVVGVLPAGRYAVRTEVANAGDVEVLTPGFAAL